MKAIFLALPLLLAGCPSIDSELQMFVDGDRANAQAISMPENPAYAACMAALAPVTRASPNPKEDGLLVIGAREMALQQAISGPSCGPILAPILLRKAGKAAGPFGIALPF